MSLDSNALINGARSIAATLGVFAKINGHEPKNAPGQGLTLSLWLDRIRPVRTSGLASTSALVVMNARIQTPFLSEPQDDIDPRLANAAGLLIGAYTADFTLGGLVRKIDLLGANGIALEGQAGYIEQDRKEFRVFTLSIPLVVNDCWPQVP